jgi:hypothetical protein
MDYDITVSKFHELLNNYINYINNLIIFLNINNILPPQILLFLPFIKNYIENNKLDILNYSIIHKNEILNFTLDDFNDEDDNQTINTYKSKLDSFNIEGGINICDLLIEIKNKSKKINKKNTNILKKNIKKITNTLNEIQQLV